jgi:hypothetical protein
MIEQQHDASRWARGCCRCQIQDASLKASIPERCLSKLLYMLAAARV